MRGRNLSTDQGPKQELDGQKAFQFCFFSCFGRISGKSQGCGDRVPAMVEGFCS